MTFRVGLGARLSRGVRTRAAPGSHRCALYLPQTQVATHEATRMRSDPWGSHPPPEQVLTRPGPQLLLESTPLHPPSPRFGKGMGLILGSIGRFHYQQL